MNVVSSIVTILIRYIPKQAEESSIPFPFPSRFPALPSICASNETGHLLVVCLLVWLWLWLVGFEPNGTEQVPFDDLTMFFMPLLSLPPGERGRVEHV